MRVSHKLTSASVYLCPNTQKQFVLFTVCNWKSLNDVLKMCTSTCSLWCAGLELKRVYGSICHSFDLFVVLSIRINLIIGQKRLLILFLCLPFWFPIYHLIVISACLSIQLFIHPSFHLCLFICIFFPVCLSYWSVCLLLSPWSAAVVLKRLFSAHVIRF